MIYLLSHIVEQAADRYPHREAIRFSGAALTYAQLAQQSNTLAAMLVEQGVKCNDRVGIYLNKSLETAVAIYGIWKAGAAYVPLDPLAPVSRLTFMINDCGIRHIVSQDNKIDALRQICLDCQLDCVIGVSSEHELPVRSVSWAEVYSMSAASPPQVLLMEQDLAYIMYTSGSTGTPKGLMHTHYSGLSFARLSADTYGVTCNDRLSNHSPLHFDMSTFDYFTGPLCGATTVIIPEAYTKLPASLSKLIQDEQLTIWYSVPFALIQLLLRGVLDQRDLTTLRWVLYGGEPFPAKHLRELMKRLPQARFSNVYGPAEVNQCTYYHLPPLSDDFDEQTPIGRVWANSEGLVIGPDDSPVGPGEVGELVVRTPTMMRGYWGRPDLNQRAFYRRQTFQNYEDIFYRTGDLVLELPDGNLRFLGRKDRQIKTRGHRVELDEIETALSSHPAVEECAVYARPDPDGSSQVDAAVILRKEAQATVRELTAYLSDMLPWYAVPAVVTIMESFPRTTSGKIDRRALREAAVLQEMQT